jgi:protein TonB
MTEKTDFGTYMRTQVRQGSAAGLRYERRYERPVETVWEALTDPARLADWMGAARVEPYVGGRYELFIDTAQPMKGRVVTWKSPELLEFSWNGAGAPQSLVRCELVREGSGTRLIFMHRALRFAATCLSLGVFRMTYLKQQRNPLRQVANVGLVLLLHAGLGYVVVTALGHSVVEVLRGATEVQVIDELKPVDQPPPLPSPPKLFPTPLATIVPPEIRVQSQSQLQQVRSDPDLIQPLFRPPEEKAPVQPVRVAPIIDAARSCKLPQYPAVSVRMSEEGLVDLDFLIEPDGHVADSRIAHSSGHGRLDDAARDALALCRFTPGTVDGKPESSWAHIRYRWTLAQ